MTANSTQMGRKKTLILAAADASPVTVELPDAPGLSLVSFRRLLQQQQLRNETRRPHIPSDTSTSSSTSVARSSTSESTRQHAVVPAAAPHTSRQQRTPSKVPKILRRCRQQSSSTVLAADVKPKNASYLDSYMQQVRRGAVCRAANQLRRASVPPMSRSQLELKSKLLAVQLLRGRPKHSAAADVPRRFSYPPQTNQVATSSSSGIASKTDCKDKAGRNERLPLPRLQPAGDRGNKRNAPKKTEPSSPVFEGPKCQTAKPAPIQLKPIKLPPPKRLAQLLAARQQQQPSPMRTTVIGTPRPAHHCETPGLVQRVNLDSARRAGRQRLQQLLGNGALPRPIGSGRQLHPVVNMAAHSLPAPVPLPNYIRPWLQRIETSPKPIDSRAGRAADVATSSASQPRPVTAPTDLARPAASSSAPLIAMRTAQITPRKPTVREPSERRPVRFPHLMNGIAEMPPTLSPPMPMFGNEAPVRMKSSCRMSGFTAGGNGAAIKRRDLENPTLVSASAPKPVVVETAQRVQPVEQTAPLCMSPGSDMQLCSPYNNPLLSESASGTREPAEPMDLIDVVNVSSSAGSSSVPDEQSELCNIMLCESGSSSSHSVLLTPPANAKPGRPLLIAPNSITRSPVDSSGGIDDDMQAIYSAMRGLGDGGGSLRLGQSASCSVSTLTYTTSRSHASSQVNTVYSCEANNASTPGSQPKSGAPTTPWWQHVVRFMLKKGYGSDQIQSELQSAFGQLNGSERQQLRQYLSRTRTYRRL